MTASPTTVLASGGMEQLPPPRGEGTTPALSDWIPIGRACHILGVNPATLRQWTKAGKVQVYRTPGGHRRFSAAELAVLQHGTDTPPSPALADTVVAELQSKYRGFSNSAATHHGWLAGID